LRDKTIAKIPIWFLNTKG